MKLKSFKLGPRPDNRYHGGMRYFLVRFVGALLICFTGSAADLRAQGQPLSREAAEAYHGVGRLDIAGSRFCTATLIGPSHVLTAAHCLYNPRTHIRVPDRSMRFTAGLHGGSHAAHRRVVASAILPDYRYDGVVSHERVRTDIAVLALDSPIAAAQVAPLVLGGAMRSGEPLMLVSYSRGQPDRPAHQANGAVLGRQGSVAALSFNVTHGASGSPVLAVSDGRIRVVGIVSASASKQGRPIALTVMTGDLVPRLAAMLPGATQVARIDVAGGGS